MLGHKSYRKRPLLHALSPTSDDISDGRSVGRHSVLSRRSDGGKSAVSELAEGLRQQSKWLYTREYLLILIEAFMSMAAYVVRARNLSADELERIRSTERLELIQLTYWFGYSTLLSFVVGCLADSYIKHYTMAMFTVVLHFAVSSLVFMEETIIKGNKKSNPYAAFIRNICTVALVLMKSSDFMRLVYGLQGMVNRTKSAVYLFIFFQFWVSSPSSPFSFAFRFTNTRISVVAFVGSGLSLFMFVYVLYPEAKEKETKGLGCKVVRCLLLATYYKIFRVRVRGKRGFLDNTEGKCEKSTISRTYELVILYLLLLPTIGVHFFSVMTPDLTFNTMFIKTKTNEFTDAIGLKRLGRVVEAIAMLLSYFGLWPLLTLIGVKKLDSTKFVLGHLIMLVCLFYSGVVTRRIEDPKYPYNSGFVRIYNAREKPIYVIPQDDFSTYSFTVDPYSATMVAYPSDYTVNWLFPMKIIFNGTKTNFTTFMSVTPDEATGYIATYPPEIVRIAGYLPLREAPPGTKFRSWPRIYVFNAAQTLSREFLKIKEHKEEAPHRKVGLQGLKVAALEPGAYDFSLSESEVHANGFNFEKGGVYGVMVFATKSSKMITVDTVVPPNTTTIWVVIVFCILSGLTYGIAQPTLLGIISNISPRSLPAMSMSFVTVLGGMSYWTSYIVFRKFRFVESNVLLAYFSVETLFFFLFLFFLFKFKLNYS